MQHIPRFLQRDQRQGGRRSSADVGTHVPAARVSSRRRAARPGIVDTSALGRRDLPQAGLARATGRHVTIPEDLCQDLSVLELRRGLSWVDGEAGERREGGREGSQDPG